MSRGALHPSLVAVEVVTGTRNEAGFRNEGPSPRCSRHSDRIMVGDVRGGLVGMQDVSNRVWWAGACSWDGILMAALLEAGAAQASFRCTVGALTGLAAALTCIITTNGRNLIAHLSLAVSALYLVSDQ